MTDEKRKRNSQETHERRAGNSRALASAQPQSMLYRLDEQSQLQPMQMQTWPAGFGSYAQPSGPPMSAITNMNDQDAHIRRDGQPMVPTAQQQQQVLSFPYANSQPQYIMPAQQVPEHSQNMQFHGATMQQNMHADCHSAGQCPANMRLKTLETLYEEKSRDYIKLNEMVGRSRYPTSKDRSEVSSLKAENAELRAEMAKLKAELALSKVQETMLRDHIPGNNGTLHSDPQATTYHDTASSPQVLTPTSSSSNMSADSCFPKNGTSQQSGDSGQIDPAFAELAATALAGVSATNSDGAATDSHGGLYTSLPLTGEATSNGNPAWSGAPSQMQQNIELAAFEPHGGLHIPLPTTNASWGGNSAIHGGPGQMQQVSNSAAVHPYGDLRISPELTGIVPGNSYSWINAPEEMHQNMMQQPGYGPASTVPILHVDSVVDAQPVVDMSYGLAPITGNTPNEAWDMDDIFDFDGGIV